MKITVDTNFLVSATQWDYSVGYKLLNKLIEKEVEIFTTNEIIDEFAKVLARDWGYANEEINDIIEEILSVIKIIEPSEKVDVIEEDPDDNKILECAIASSSDYIITYDKHLRNIRNFKNIKIVTPEEVLEIIK